jgi:hypothetical protein
LNFEGTIFLGSYPPEISQRTPNHVFVAPIRARTSSELPPSASLALSSRQLLSQLSGERVAAAAAQLAMKCGKLSQQLVNRPFGDVILHFKMIVGSDSPHGLKSTLVVYLWGCIPSGFI